ncbi:MAG: 4-(cytidine 5'-diphospho)-2-C-methyl-D-erythritol kinase [Pseudomonadota bacterium]
MWTELGPAEELAPAKVNLTLHVTGRRPDGYHMLDSLVVFPRIGDVVRYEPSRTLGLSMSGAFGIDLAADRDNLVLRAAQMALPDRQGAALHLEKNLPVASGIGGGSSDAAATLRLLARVKGQEVAGDVVSLGADVPVCMTARSQRMRGIGDRLDPLPPLPTFWLVLVNPGRPVPTGDVFRRLETVHNAGCDDLPENGFDDVTALASYLRAQRNDLEAAAKAVCPAVGDVLERIAATRNVALARMSGSGATCFGLYATETDALAAADVLRADAPSWWVAAGPVSPN